MKHMPVLVFGRGIDREEVSSNLYIWIRIYSFIKVDQKNWIDKKSIKKFTYD